jgi:hypothetical protein
LPWLLEGVLSISHIRSSAAQGAKASKTAFVNGIALINVFENVHVIQ